MDDFTSSDDTNVTRKLIQAMPFYSDVESNSDVSFTYNSYERHQQTTLVLSDRKSLDLSSKSRNSSYSQQLAAIDRKLTEAKMATRKTPSKLRYFVVMLACTYLNLSGFGLVAGLGVIYVELIEAFESPRSEAALVQSLFMGIAFAGGVFFSKIIVKYDTGVCVVIASLVGTLAMIGGSFVGNIGGVIALVGVIAGLATSIIIISASCVLNWMFLGHRKLALTILTSGSAIGQIVLPYITTALVSEYFWDGCLLILSAITLLNCVVSGVIIFFNREYLHKESANKITSQKNSILETFKDSAFLIYLTTAFIFPAFGPVEQWFTVDLAVIKGFGKEAGTMILSLNGIFGFVSRIVCAVILTFFPNTRPEVHMFYSYLVWAFAHYAIVASSVYWEMVLAMVLRGLSSGIAISFIPSLQLELRGPERFTQTLVLSYLVYGVGQTLGGFLGGYSTDQTGSYNLIFYIAAVAFAYCSFSMLSIYMILRFRKKRTIDYEKM